MASSGKKGKKSKGKTLPLNDFLQETPGITTIPVKKYGNWSDEVEDAFETGYESRSKATPVVLPTAPRAARGPDISDDRIPTQPPFIAYISNLPYDVDEEDIAEFFGSMDITSMRLPRDDRGGEGGKLKGFGYVEFEDRNSLIDAISIADTNLKGRRIKIDVATSSDGDRRRGGRMDMGRDRPERPEVTMSDWRSGPRSEPTSESRGGGGGGGGGGGSGGGGMFRDRERDRDRDRDRESTAPPDRSGGWRDSADRPTFREPERERNFSRDMGDRDRDRDRGFGGFNRDSDRGSDRGFSRDSDRSGGGGFREGGFSDRGRFSERDRDRDGDRRGGGFGPRRFGDKEGFDRGGERDTEFRRGPREDGPPPERADSARSRPKLVLAPRTKPLEEQAAIDSASNEESEEPPAPAVPAASIFGAAKPVDTSARERQIEERLAKEKEVRPAPRDSSRDNKYKDDENEKAPRKEAWDRKRADDNSDESSRRDSPERRPSSRGPPPRRNDEKKSGSGIRDKILPKKEDKPPIKREERPQRDNHEREMPKLKEPEPPNFAASNIFATLEPEDVLD